MCFEEVNIEKGLKSKSGVPSNILSKHLIAQNPKMLFYLKFNKRSWVPKIVRVAITSTWPVMTSSKYSFNNLTILIIFLIWKSLNLWYGSDQYKMIMWYVLLICCVNFMHIRLLNQELFYFENICEVTSMLETKCIGDNILMLVTSHVNNIES